jgi:peptide/nickel transport system ATP-binding protein
MENSQRKTKNTELLKVDDLKIEYATRRGAVRAVDGVSFRLSDNETMGLIGESGCGKSTMVFALMRFVTPPGRIVDGKIVFEGRDIIALDDEELRRLRGKEMAIVLQGAQNALNPVLKIGTQISELILEHERIGKEKAWERAEQQLELVGISSRRVNGYPHELSGGMKQRVMIAIATACSPKLILMDEPVTGLDVIVQRQLLTLIRSLREKMNVAIIFITHDLSVVTETCNRVAVMYAGRIVEEADMITLYQQPLHPYTQALINSYPSIRGEKRKLRSIPGTPPNLIDPPPGCRYHPRCPHVMSVCPVREPDLIVVNEHRVACHLVS